MDRYIENEEWNKFPNFRKNEFRCKCNKYCNGYPSEIAYSLVELLQKCRDKFGKPIIITSGIRCSKHNDDVGGVKQSKHMNGLAVDFYFEGMNKYEVIEWLKKQDNYRYAYTNSTNMKNSVHIDVLLTTKDKKEEVILKEDYLFTYSCNKDGKYSIYLNKGEKLYIR